MLFLLAKLAAEAVTYLDVLFLVGLWEHAVQPLLAGEGLEGFAGNSVFL